VLQQYRPDLCFKELSSLFTFSTFIPDGTKGHGTELQRQNDRKQYTMPMMPTAIPHGSHSLVFQELSGGGNQGIWNCTSFATQIPSDQDTSFQPISNTSSADEPPSDD